MWVGSWRWRGSPERVEDPRCQTGIWRDLPVTVSGETLQLCSFTAPEAEEGDMVTDGHRHSVWWYKAKHEHTGQWPLHVIYLRTSLFNSDRQLSGWNSSLNEKTIIHDGVEWCLEIIWNHGSCCLKYCYCKRLLVYIPSMSVVQEINWWRRHWVPPHTQR